MSFLVKKLRPSSIAMNAANPTVMAGNRMCQPMTQANCNRDRNTGSKSVTRLSNENELAS